MTTACGRPLPQAVCLSDPSDTVKIDIITVIDQDVTTSLFLALPKDMGILPDQFFLRGGITR